MIYYNNTILHFIYELYNIYIFFVLSDPGVLKWLPGIILSIYEVNELTKQIVFFLMKTEYYLFSPFSYWWENFFKKYNITGKYLLLTYYWTETNDKIRRKYNIEKQKILSGINPNNCNVCNYHPACDIEIYRGGGINQF